MKVPTIQAGESKQCPAALCIAALLPDRFAAVRRCQLRGGIVDRGILLARLVHADCELRVKSAMTQRQSPLGSPVLMLGAEGEVPERLGGCCVEEGARGGRLRA